MIKLLGKKSTYIVIRVLGFTVLAGYLLFSSDLSFSIIGAAAYIVIAILVSYLIAGLKFAEHFPKLNKYYFHPVRENRQSQTLSETEWALRQAEFLESGLRGRAILLAPSEDGLICIPLILAGISSTTAFLGGAAFGILHLGRFTYLECIAKSIYYGLACFLVLPYGVLTVVVGHLATDLISLMTLKVVKWKLSKQKLPEQSDRPT